MTWLLLAALYALGLLFVWSLCVAAARGDRMADAAHQQLLKERGRA